MTAIAASRATDRQTFLRRVMYVDAATCIAMGVLLTQDAAFLAGPLGLPAALLKGSGVSLFPIGAFMFLVATRRPIPALGAWAVILGNVAWVLASVALAMETNMTSLGYAFVLGQAAATAILADLEYVGLKRIA